MTSFDVALSLVLAAHLLLADVAMAGPLVCVWLDARRSRRDDRLAARVGYLVAHDSVASLLLGAGLGVVLLGLWWSSADERFWESVRALPALRLWFALAELIFSLVCLGWYLAMWNAGPRRRVWRSLVAIAGATNLAYHFPLLFAILAVVRTRPELVGTTLDREALHKLLLDPEVLSRAFHVWLAAAAVAGVVVMLRSSRIGRCTADQPAAQAREMQAEARQLTILGARLALAATLLQLPIGVWVLLQMPARGRAAVSGGEAVASILFCVAIVAALRLIHLLASVAMDDIAAETEAAGEAEPGASIAKQARGVAVMMVAVVLFMTAAMHQAQQAQQIHRMETIAGQRLRSPLAPREDLP